VIPPACTLPGATRVHGHATGVDLHSCIACYTTADGAAGQLPDDRLLLTPGSVTRLLHIPASPSTPPG